jgi:MFS family permease
LSIVSTAAPRIGAALRVPATAIGLVITAYLTTLAVLIPLSGWAVSRFGTRRVFLTAIVLFVFVGNIGIKPATSYLLNRFGFRTVLLANKQGGERAGLTHILASAH